MSTLELGTIKSARTAFEGDHNCHYLEVHLDFGGGEQSFMMISDEADLPAMSTALCKAFDVSCLKQLVGKRAYALRSFPTWNETIEGVASPDTDLRFTRTGWRRRHGATKSPLELKRESIKSDIASKRRRIAELTAQLERLDANFVSWEHSEADMAAQ